VENPQTRYARSGDLSIAYQVVGEGPFDLVFVPGTFSHLELEWKMPSWAEYNRRLAEFSRLIRLDKRGSGMSDRVAGAPSLEERMDDIRAVMEVVESERAAVFGFSEGGALAALFAATYPRRVWALVLWGAVPRMLRAPDYPWGSTDLEWRQAAEEEERRFGEPEFMREWVRPVVQGLPEEEIEQLAEMARLSLSPGALAAINRMNREIDVREILSTIRVPTLACAGTDDFDHMREGTKFMADRIAGARLAVFEGLGHAPLVGDVDPSVKVVREFLEETWEARAWEEDEPDRVLSTVLFTDIVGSTAKAVEQGDARWRELLAEHHRVIRQQLMRFRGRELDTAGDGFFASFDGPARAIRCACAITEGVKPIGLEVRAGLHTGECELIDGKVGGVAVHIGARVASLADPGEVLVSGTVKDLVAGSGIAFDDRGAHELKGIPGDWRLFAVASAS
jgi:class 3 adenylate cyclase/pimeloyl-ACP methyl ester carboxylesterase